MPDDKPPYRVPLVSEIAEIPWNGFTVATTFAGAGGSSTGYRMAGFRVIYANEFVPIAQESYRANCRPGTVVDGRDVKLVKGADILAAGDLKVGELDLFDGSPPCQAFSTAGRREKGWGKDKVYEHGAEQKNEDLFFDYVRLRDEMMPRAFVAENVSGLVKGTAKGFFIEIMRLLRKGYRVEARMLDAQWLGVPQQRQRIIIVGVREDIEMDPVFPKPLPYRYSVRDALPWLTRAVHDTSRLFSNGDFLNRASPTIMSSPRDARHYQAFGPEPALVQNSNAAHSRKGERRSLEEPSPTLLVRRANVELENVVEPETDISGQAIGREYDKLNPGQQSDKYFSLVRADAERPSPTITAAGGQNSGIATVVHPTEKRKFTILEVKRLCSFPDDFVLKGTYGAQWERLGNSVPPLMMKAIAETIRDKVLIPWRDRQPQAKKAGWNSESSTASGATSTRKGRTSAGRGKARRGKATGDFGTAKRSSPPTSSR